MMRPNDVKELISMWMIDVDHFNVNMFILNVISIESFIVTAHHNQSSQSIMFVTLNVVKIKSNVWIDLNIENIINQIQYNL